jgi:hypothetical protein
VQERIFNRLLREVDSDDDSIEDGVDAIYCGELVAAQSTRYVSRKQYRKSTRMEEVFKDDSIEDECQTCDGDWLRKAEFKQKYRMDRYSFKRVLNKIKDHSIFKNSSGRKQFPVYKQLMVFLKFVGTEGDGASNNGQRNTLCIGYGSARIFSTRVAKALVSLDNEYMSWPDIDERKVIAKEFQDLADFPRCVGIIDATLCPLAFQPQTKSPLTTMEENLPTPFQFSLSTTRKGESVTTLRDSLDLLMTT